MADYNSVHTGAEIDEAVRKVKEGDIPAGSVKFSDGESFQEKYNAGDLTGPKGDTGDTGPKGDPGDTGTQGPAGADGKSAYESAQDGGYTGTESEFNADLAGVKNALKAESGGTVSMGQSLGSGPYAISMTEEEEGDLTAAQVGYNNTATGMTATDVQAAITELFTSVSEGKAQIAGAITDKGVSTSGEASFQQMAANIAAIVSDPYGVKVHENVASFKSEMYNSEGRTVNGLILIRVKPGSLWGPIPDQCVSIPNVALFQQIASGKLYTSQLSISEYAYLEISVGEDFLYYIGFLDDSGELPWLEAFSNFGVTGDEDTADPENDDYTLTFITYEVQG